MTSPNRSVSSERSGDESAFMKRLARVFNEGVMGLLALVALATALGPMVFDVSVDAEHVLTIVEWTLVAAFASEFVIQGAVAQDRHAWLRSPWRIVDAVTVLGPVVALLPQVSDLARGSLMLRMLRVGRAIAFGTRAGSVVVRRERGDSHATHATTPTVSVVNAEGDLHPVRSDWATFLAWTRAPGASWFHASNLDRHHFSEIARAAGVSDRDVEQALGEDGHAKLRQEASHATLVLQMPTVASSGFPQVHRDHIFAVITARGLLTATTGSVNLQDSIVSQQAALPTASFPVRIVCALLSMTRERNLEVAQRFDDEARRLETLDGGHVFLRETFRLRREISAAALDLWHVKGIIRALADGKTRLRGVDLRDEKYLDDLLTETESLWETVNENKEELKTLIELHINFKSFEMNKFLKLLAVVSFLGLIPSVAGGLLGMNVAGNPWPVTLGQVAFGVAMGMATALYVFAVKGWLK
jgi:Mg2+ and Co2+ transporter CorA